MAEDKVDQILKDAEYSVKLILGREPGNGPVMVDITDPVIRTLDSDYVMGNDSEHGIRYKIIGIREEANGENFGFAYTEALRTPRGFSISLYQNIRRILQASIVNAKQLESVLSLIDEAFTKEASDQREGAKFAIKQCMHPACDGYDPEVDDYLSA